MAKGGQTTTQRTGLDTRSQGHVDELRRFARQGANQLQGGGPLFLGADPRSIQEQLQPFLNPYMQNVIDPIRGEFDRLRGQARSATSEAATRAGAFGGSRAGVAEGVRLGELDRAQAGQIGGLLSSGYQDALSRGLGYSEYVRGLQERQLQEPLFRAQQQLQLLNMGLGPTGQVSTTTTPPPSLGGQLLGAGLAVGSRFIDPSGTLGAAAAGGPSLFGGFGGGGGNQLTGFGGAPAGYAGSVFDPNSARLRTRFQ